MIRPVTSSDANNICDIYNEYIQNTIITFEEQDVTAEEIISRIKKITQHYPWLVYEENGKVVGYTYASKWKERSAYRHSVEVAIYLDHDVVGKGIGTLLIRALLEKLKHTEIHCVIYGVSLPNAASVALCKKFGFQKVAHFKEVGYKLDKWIDVGYWELILK